MKILILGASQGTGALTAKTALGRGHDVTVFARTPQKLVLDHAKLTRVAGDFTKRDPVEHAVPGHDAVVITASVSSLSDFKTHPTFFSLGTSYAIDAMKADGVKRLVVLSALGTGESRRLPNVFVRTFVMGWLLKPAFDDHERQEKLVEASGLDWTIARPGRLTNGPAHKRYLKKDSVEPVPSAISRADVADFLVEACERDTWVHKAVQLGG